MKKLQIITLLAATLMTLSACSMPDVKKLDSQSQAFALEFLNSQKEGLDGSKLAQYFGTKSSPADVRAMLAAYSRAGGPISFSGKLNHGRQNIGAGINIPDYTVECSADIYCKGKPATENFTVCHEDNQWFVKNFSIQSEAIHGDPKATALATKVADALLKNWSAETLRKNASKKHSKEFASPACTALCSTGKMMGPLQGSGGVKFRGFFSQSGELCEVYTDDADFKNAKGRLTLYLEDEGGEWKVAGFYINSGTQTQI